MNQKAKNILYSVLFSAVIVSYVHACDKPVTCSADRYALLRELAKPALLQATQTPEYQEVSIIKALVRHAQDVRRNVYRICPNRAGLEIPKPDELSPKDFSLPVKEGVFISTHVKNIYVLSRWGEIPLYPGMYFGMGNDYSVFQKLFLTGIRAMFIGAIPEQKDSPEPKIHETVVENWPVENSYLLNTKTVHLTPQEQDEARGSINRAFGLAWGAGSRGRLLYQLLQAEDIETEPIDPISVPIRSWDFKTREQCKKEWDRCLMIYNLAQSMR